MDDTIRARMEQAQRARVQTLAQFRAKLIHEMTLPQSGLTVYLRDASITDLMLLGKLPQSLLNTIIAESEKDGQKNESIDLAQFSNSDQFGALVNGVVMACVVEPPVAEKGDDEHLGIDEIPGDDRMKIFEWANREVTPLADKFRTKTRKSNPAP